MRKVKELFDLHDKVALVTGGSRGLGLQMAEALGEQGARVAIAARTVQELDHTLAHLRQRGILAHAFVADLADDAAIAALADDVMRTCGKIDILVNNAGITWAAPAENYPVDAWDRIMKLNVRSVFLLSQEAARRSMIPNRRGRIINIASIAGLTGNPPDMMRTIAYNTSKGAVVNFTRALAAEWGRHGITVNAIAPGFFPSKMTQGLLRQTGAEPLAQLAPLQRIGDDEDLKGAVVLFASDAGKHITGQILAIDGGLSAV